MSELFEYVVPSDHNQGAAVEPVETPPEEGQNGLVTAKAEEPAASATTPSDRHVEAGRKGARRFHELVQRGRLYEQEHGLKRGRQRLRQLVELGKLYEKEHGLSPTRTRKRADRLGRGERKQLVGTLLRCLLRIARPSLRADLVRLIDALDETKLGDAAQGINPVEPRRVL
jgi:hypothetical protein